MRYKIQGGYIDLEPISKTKEISDKLAKIASNPVKEAEIIKSSKDIENVGSRKGDAGHFLVEK